MRIAQHGHCLSGGTIVVNRPDVSIFNNQVSRWLVLCEAFRRSMAPTPAMRATARMTAICITFLSTSRMETNVTLCAHKKVVCCRARTRGMCDYEREWRCNQKRWFLQFWRANRPASQEAARADTTGAGKPARVCFSRVRALAQKLGTDPATVTRILQGLGFEGYRDFKAYLHELAIATATWLQGLQAIAPGNSNTVSEARRATEQDLQNLHALRNTLDMERLISVSEKKIYRARKILLLDARRCSAGSRASAPSRCRSCA